jgi:stage II sporulation protein D
VALGIAALTLGVAVVHASRQSAAPVPDGAAFFVRPLSGAGERREARADILDTPILPGSVIKAVTLVAALESQVIEPGTSRLCRRTVAIDGHRYVCTHPDLKRPLTPAEALAYSCNDYFVPLAPRLPRATLNAVRQRAGLPQIPAGANYAASLVGLDGPRITPRALLDVVSRLAAADADRPIPMAESTRRVLREGLAGAARFGTASALGDRGIAAMAKTGTAPMPGGSFLGLIVALEPADNPTRGVVVVAPGAAGLDAASIAADLLAARRAEREQPQPPAAGKPADGGLASGKSRSVLVPPEGPVRIGVTGGSGAPRVVEMALEDYVARVLAGEGQPRAGAAAQQALAMTVRTFAVANRGRHRREGFDFCDTTHCQVFRTATAMTERAAEATAGLILLHDGQPATVFYSALCGGKSELASELWPGSIDYLSSPQADPACADEPGWTSELRAEQIEHALRAEAYRGQRLRALRVLRRDASGRVARLGLDGFTPDEISGNDFRMAIGRTAGWNLIRSTAFDLRRTGGGYRFQGRGYGHGVGLCVIGAGNRAASGASADAILKFYFPTLQVGSVPRTPVTTAASATPVAPPASKDRPPAPAARADVLVAVPAGEENERSRLADLVRSARDAIASSTTVGAPATIRVTVHPTVEAFGRATGQPWWVSGATDGTSIDLLPLTILRQRGQLDRTIRHEVAHVLLDSTLRGRPLWVREGAAFYFADPTPAAELVSHPSCPKDDEFLRPISAGAHRAAYARAESCFRRAIANGKPWSEVGR